MPKFASAAIFVFLLLCACTVQEDQGDISNEAVSSASDEMQEGTQQIERAPM